MFKEVLELNVENSTVSEKLKKENILRKGHNRPEAVLTNTTHDFLNACVWGSPCQIHINNY